MARIALTVSVGALALACASTPVSFRTFQHSVKNETREVSPGHWAGPWETRGFCVRMAGTKDEEVGIWGASGTFDGQWTSRTTMSSCGMKGSSDCAFPDGSSFSEESTWTCRLDPDGKLVFDITSSKFVKGTGRFDGIQGGLIIRSHKVLAPPPEELTYDIGELKYTLPRK